MPNNYSVKYVFEAFDNMSQSLKEIEKNVKKIDDRFKKTTKTVPRFNAVMKKTGNTLKMIASKSRTMSLAMAGVATGSVMAFSKMEKGLTDTLTLLKDKSTVEKYRGRLSDLQKAAVKAGFSIQDASSALFDTVSSLGLSENSMKAYVAAQKLAIGGSADLRAAVLGMSKIMNVYGVETTNVNEVVNALFTAQKVGTTTVQDLAMNVGKVSGQAKMAGMSFQSMTSVLSILTNTLSNTEEASTSMAAILKAVTNPAKDAESILGALQITTGVTAVKQVGFVNVLKQVRDAMKKYPDYVARAIPEIRALKGISTITDDSLRLMSSTVKQMGKDLENGTGLTEAFNMQQKTMDRQLKRVRGAILLFSRSIGEVLAPYVSTVADKFLNLLEAFDSLGSNGKKMTAALIVIGAAFAPLVAIASAFALALAAIGWTGFIVIGAISAISAAIAGLVIYWDELVTLVEKTWNKLTTMPFMKLNALFGIDIEEKLGNKEDMTPVSYTAPGSYADINMNINAPEGVVDNIFTDTKNAKFNLGLNMTPAGSGI